MVSNLLTLSRWLLYRPSKNVEIRREKECDLKDDQNEIKSCTGHYATSNASLKYFLSIYRIFRCLDFGEQECTYKGISSASLFGIFVRDVCILTVSNTLRDDNTGSIIGVVEILHLYRHYGIFIQVRISGNWIQSIR